MVLEGRTQAQTARLYGVSEGWVFKLVARWHPTTCGKVERFQQTLKKWLTAQTPANDLNELQALLNEFTDTS